MVGVRSRAARIRSTAFAYANLAPYVFFVLFPFYFMVVTSFKSNAELYNLKSIPFWIQSGAILDHYALLFQKTDFVTWMKNSLLVAVVATAVSVAISILAGYSLARLRFPGRDLVFGIMVAALMVRRSSSIIPSVTRRRASTRWRSAS